MPSMLSGGAGVAAATNPWLAAGMFALDTVGGGLAGGQAQANANADRKQRWEEFLAQMNQRRSEQGDDRGKFAAQLSSTQAMQPLADRGFSALQARFAQGPGTFGQIGNQNRQMQQTAANYQPGQNPSMQQYGADLQGLKDRFMSPPGELSGGGPPPGPTEIDPATGRPRWFADSRRSFRG